MLYIKPDYYDSFVCTADRCEDTCCAGWQIVIDEEALKRYKKFKGSYRRELHKGISWRKRCFKQDRLKRCAFLNDDNLCDMYLACGDGIFCKTCDKYPRHIEEFEGVRETSLSVSCPEVAKALMARKRPVNFLQVETDEEETCKDFEDMDFDVLLYDILSEGRDVMLRILQNRRLALDLRLELVLHMAAKMQDALDEGAVFTCQDIFPEYAKFAQDADVNDTKPHMNAAAFAGHADLNTNAAALADNSYLKDSIPDHPKTSTAPELPFTRRRLKKEKAMEYSKQVMNGLFGLERLREEWEKCLTDSALALYLEGESAYEKATENFESWQKTGGTAKDFEDSADNSTVGQASKEPTKAVLDLTIPYEQLAVYFIFTYFCGAVYNDDILVKVQASVLCIYAIEELLKARWIMNKGMLSQDELYEIVYRFSRELEHSDENLNRIEKIAAKLLPVG